MSGPVFVIGMHKTKFYNSVAFAAGDRHGVFWTGEKKACRKMRRYVPTLRQMLEPDSERYLFTSPHAGKGKGTERYHAFTPNTSSPPGFQHPLLQCRPSLRPKYLRSNQAAPTYTEIQSVLVISHLTSTCNPYRTPLSHIHMHSRTKRIVS